MKQFRGSAENKTPTEHLTVIFIRKRFIFAYPTILKGKYMNTKIKKLIAALLIPAILLTSAACSSGNEAEVTTPTETAANTSAAQDTEQASEEDPAADTSSETVQTEKTEETSESALSDTTETTETAETTESSETSSQETTTEAAATTEETTTVSTTTATSATTTSVSTATSKAATTTSATTTTAATTTIAATTAATTTKPAETTSAPTTSPVSGMRQITTMELVREMGVGINLGNTLESCHVTWISNPTVSSFETAWGSPIITDDIIKGYAKCGFGVLRIPVAWSNLMSANYTIHPDYMARVKQIVDWTLDSGMYAIVNIHYDSGWWSEFPTDKEKCMKKYTRIWEQISEAFKDYPDKLMFESLNEEGGWESLWNRWSGSTNGKAESFGILNEINQKFVDIVRSSGGNNPKRHLLIAGYNTDIELTCDSLFVMPSDKENRCAVSVHYYTPSTFCILEEDADWGKAKTEWGSANDVKELTDNLDKVKARFIDKGIPVIIGEYGVSTGNKTPEMIRLFLSSVAKEAYSRQICPVLWDITNVFYDRQLCKFRDDELLRQILAAKS